MGNPEKRLQSPCFEVLEWIIDRSDATPFDRLAARTIREHGINSDRQERLLADACESCGMRDVCEYADECGIGEIERAPPAVPPNVGKQARLVDAGHLRKG